MKGNRMKTANLVVVLDKENKSVLLCKRMKNPYKGLLNFVGGKIEKEEDGLTAAYRELWEETGITDADIELTHLMDFNYLVFDNWLEVYFGRLNKDFTVRGEENELLWIDISSDFFDVTQFAGRGNMGHIMELIKEYESDLPDEEKY